MSARSALWVTAALLVLSPGLLAAEESLPSPITLREERVEGGWYLYRPHHGTFAEMGSSFARFAVLRAARGGEGRLVAVLLEDRPRSPLVRAQVGLLLAERPAREPRAFLMRPMEPTLAAVGEASGSWGAAAVRTSEVRAWAEVVGLDPTGPVRLIFEGDPQDPSTLAWQVQLPVRRPPPAAEEEAEEEGGPRAPQEEQRP